MAERRVACRSAAHPLADRIHGHRLSMAVSAIHIDAALVTVDGLFADVPGLVLASVLLEWSVAGNATRQRDIRLAGNARAVELAR
jgi:hypothetical protein